ncbi:HEPN domain-containing protein [Candidatus Woesearchaeota archaeon]|nr:HEPN domain-containing protein [Candidatus Woesearchaeota archaeon]
MNSFIKKLKKEEKIKITEPSQEICFAYLEKSEKSLISAKTLTKIENYDDAVALTYYSMYYCSLALLYKIGIKSENHTATIILLKEFFKIDNKKLQEAKKERVDKQYYTDFKATKEDVKKGIIIAEEFNTEIREKIATLKKTEIQKIQEKIKQL